MGTFGDVVCPNAAKGGSTSPLFDDERIAEGGSGRLGGRGCRRDRRASFATLSLVLLFLCWVK